MQMKVVSNSFQVNIAVRGVISIFSNRRQKADLLGL